MYVPALLSRKRLIAIVAGLAVASTVGLTATTASADSSDTGKRAPGTSATWSDEFDGDAGKAPDAGKWTHEINGDGGGNQERQYYTDSTDNAALDGNGNLVITARNENPDNLQCWYGNCEYTSARLTTAKAFKQKYGHFEARIKVPSGAGMWPAFWMLGDSFNSGTQWPDCGELDIMENVGNEPSTVHGTLHGPGFSGENGLTGDYGLPDGKAFSDDFHTFAVDWSKDKIDFSVDGNVYQTLTPADAGGNSWPFDQPFFIILNVAVGGAWPGDPDENTKFPQEMVVDYVRVDA